MHRLDFWFGRCITRRLPWFRFFLGLAISAHSCDLSVFRTLIASSPPSLSFSSFSSFLLLSISPSTYPLTRSLRSRSGCSLSKLGTLLSQTGHSKACSTKCVVMHSSQNCESQQGVRTASHTSFLHIGHVNAASRGSWSRTAAPVNVLGFAASFFHWRLLVSGSSEMRRLGVLVWHSTDETTISGQHGTSG